MSVRDNWERLRRAEATSWETVHSFRDKHDSGHEAPWARFLAGENPDYPERILHTAHQQLSRRLAQLRTDQHVGTQHHIHHWQWGNPVTSEALVQLALGAPQPIYNGGLLHARLRYYDVERRRPGLPLDVGTLVESLETDRTVVQLVNLSPTESRTLRIGAGTFGEHRFGSATWQSRTSEWPGELGGYKGSYAAPAVTSKERRLDLDSGHVEVALPPASRIRLDLVTLRYVNEPTYSVW